MRTTMSSAVVLAGFAIACGGKAPAKSPPPPPAGSATAPAPIDRSRGTAEAPSCREAIEGSWRRMGETGEVGASVEVCERQKWSPDMRRCLGKVSTKAELVECGKMLPPASADEIDDIRRRSIEAVKKIEAFADQACACKDLDCAAMVAEAAGKWGKEIPPIMPPDQPASKVAYQRFVDCMDRFRRK